MLVKGNGTSVKQEAIVDNSGAWKIKFQNIHIGSHASQGYIYAKLLKIPNPNHCMKYYVVTKRGETDDAGFPKGAVALTPCGK